MENQTPITSIANSPEVTNKVDQDPLTVTQAVDRRSSTNSFLIILLSILLLISVLISGFFAYQTQKLVNELQVTSDKSKQTAEVTPEPTLDPTADWKTYKNSKYQIAFEYPSTWEFTETKEPDVQTWYDASIFQLISPNVLSFDHGEINGGYYLAFNVSKPNPNYSDFQEFLNYSKDQYKYTFTSRKINNIDGYVFTQNGKETGYMFNKNNLFFVVNLLTDKDTQTLDQILSTFKFTN